MNKRRLIIIVCTLLLVVIIVGVTIVITRKNNEPANNENSNNGANQNVITTRKLQEYIASLTDNYYIKYHGKFKNNSGELVSAVVEYTKDGEKFAFRSSELNMYLVCEKNKLYSISHRYNLIVEMDKKNFDTSEYNLASNIGQTFIKAYKESLNNSEYYVEEYLFNGKILKYYFKDNDIKLIRYDGEDITIIRLEKQTNSELLTRPEWYTYEKI